MTIVNLQVTFESLITVITSLNLEEKQELLEDLIEEDSQIISEVAEARKACQNGDYQTIQEYIANRNHQIS